MSRDPFFFISSSQLEVTYHGRRWAPWTVRGCPTLETAEMRVRMTRVRMTRVRMTRAGRSSNISLPPLYHGRACVKLDGPVYLSGHGIPSSGRADGGGPE
jgi:hypothetical protein